ncbi:unnamed protein product [Arabidopsis lyrata]|uniref:Uncharacterized protein n=1 Tax=Arabidopsis suecica TaxID=45249 RepID=A0A8T2BP16_ARASU|nr:hypothetical protein ISN44_As07g014420 [Arabidopsis suecica]CAH8257250.1 unnamed protein product [Arabidopsis lyrata]
MISNRFNVADFGGTSGPNTSFGGTKHTDVVGDKYLRETGQNPVDKIEFQPPQRL